MSFIEYFAKRFSKYFDDSFISISDSDVELLAAMCVCCRSWLEKREGLFHHAFAYYVPQMESDLEIAQEIFKKNKIPMTVHSSHIFGSEAQNVLRVDYNNFLNKNHVRSEIRKISNKHNSFYLSFPREEKRKLEEKLMNLRQRQK